MVRIADPVLKALSENEFKKHMPIEEAGRDRSKFTYFEAPWLELGPDDTKGFTDVIMGLKSRIL